MKDLIKEEQERKEQYLAQTLEFFSEFKLGLNTYKFVGAGAELLKSVGSDVVCKEFKKTEDGKWEVGYKKIVLEAMGNHETIVDGGTYDIEYREYIDSETLGAVVKEKIFPQGFSAVDPDDTGWSHQFMPVWLFYKQESETRFWSRLEDLWETRKTWELEGLRTLSGDPDISKTLEFSRYLAVLIDTDVPGGLGIGLLQFRLKTLKMMTYESHTTLYLGYEPGEDPFVIKVLPSDIEAGTLKLNYGRDKTFIGDLKIIDIQGQ